MKTFLEFIRVYEEDGGATAATAAGEAAGTTTTDIATVPHGLYTSTNKTNKTSKTSKTKNLDIFKRIHPLYTPYYTPYEKEKK